MALFESYERREKQILAKLAEYGINSIEEAAEVTKAAGLDVYKMIEGIQPICFENACWAYITGAAIAITITIAIRHRPMIACGLLSSLCIIFFPHHPWTKQTVDYVCHEICDNKNCCNDDYTGRNCNRICCNHTVHQISSDSLD